MIDFRLKTAEQKAGGLNLGLCPGLYAEKSSHQQTLYLTENAFSIIEPSIRRHSGRYARPFGHWGISEISGDEWQKIIQDWQQLKGNISTATKGEEIPIEFEEVEREFNKDFEVNKAALLNMIEQLTNWLLLTLKTYEQISLLGI